MFNVGDEIYSFDEPEGVGVVTKIDRDSFTEKTRVWADWKTGVDAGTTLWIPLQNARLVIPESDIAHAMKVLTNAGFRVTLEKL